MDARGFLRPTQHETLDAPEEERLSQVCPGLGMQQDAGRRADSVLWGPILAVRSGHAVDQKLRHHASSGGALSALLTHLLDSGKVDFVYQTAASQNHPLKNSSVISLDREAVYGAAGSRYAPSAPLAEIRTALERNGRAGFVGKPCDVAALRALCRHDQELAAKFPYLISFFCAGIPSHGAVRRILSALKVEEAQVSTFQFRGDGWPGHARAVLHDGGSVSMTYAASWGGILSKDVQFRCKVCPDGVGGFADVVCADAWHCDADGYPLFEEEPGVSLVISRTEIGEKLVVDAMDAGVLSAKPLDPAEISDMQPGQLRRKRLLLSRLVAMAVLFRRWPRYRGFNLLAAARQPGLVANLRSFLGTLRRLVYRRPAA